MFLYHSIRQWIALLACCMVIVLAGHSAQGEAVVPEWPVYQEGDPEMKSLEPTGADLIWSTVSEVGSVRQLMSNNPECLGIATDYSSLERIEATRYPQPNQEGKLWVDEAEHPEALSYHVFLWHMNCFFKPMNLGLVIENLSAENGLEISGAYISRNGPQSREGTWKDWAEMKMVGKVLSYADLSDTLFVPLKAMNIPPAEQKPREHLVLSWPLNSYDLFGAHVRLVVRPRPGERGSVRCRVSTAWAWNRETLASGMPLLAKHYNQPRGSWATSELMLTNRDNPFEVGTNDQQGRNVRSIRLCQPRYENNIKVGYGPDVVYTVNRSFAPEQAYMNNGLYGVRVGMRLHVRNSGKNDVSVALHLRYVVNAGRGSYSGAATVYEQIANGDWKSRETRAVELSAMDYPANSGDRATRREFWTITKPIAEYQVKAGRTLEIPLTVMNNGPSTLPLAIVMSQKAQWTMNRI